MAPFQATRGAHFAMLFIINLIQLSNLQVFFSGFLRIFYRVSRRGFSHTGHNFSNSSRLQTPLCFLLLQEFNQLPLWTCVCVCVCSCVYVRSCGYMCGCVCVRTWVQSIFPQALPGRAPTRDLLAEGSPHPRTLRKNPLIRSHRNMF